MVVYGQNQLVVCVLPIGTWNFCLFLKVCVDWWLLPAAPVYCLWNTSTGEHGTVRLKSRSCPSHGLRLVSSQQWPSWLFRPFALLDNHSLTSEYTGMRNPSEHHPAKFFPNSWLKSLQALLNGWCLKNTTFCNNTNSAMKREPHCHSCSCTLDYWAIDFPVFSASNLSLLC